MFCRLFCLSVMELGVTSLFFHQHMSDMELQRRHVTNTLMSCSVTAKTVKKLSTNPVSAVQQAKVDVVVDVEVDVGDVLREN